jgi:hypothetical protein
VISDKWRGTGEGNYELRMTGRGKIGGFFAEFALRPILPPCGIRAVRKWRASGLRITGHPAGVCATPACGETASFQLGDVSYGVNSIEQKAPDGSAIHSAGYTL